MEGDKGLLESGAGAGAWVAGCSSELGVCTACCWLFGIPDRQQLLINLLPGGLLGACIRQEATASAEKFADSREMNCHSAHAVGETT